MRIRGCLLLAALAGCGEDDPLAVCEGGQPLHLSDADASVTRSRDDTFITLDDYSKGRWTQIGPACGAAPTLSFEGVALTPARIHLDPDDDDPTIVCAQDSLRLHRIDPAGGPPRLLLPHLRCDATPTAHGPLFETQLASGALWLVPDFPDDRTAVPIGADVREFKIADDFVYNRDRFSALARTDLATGATTTLAGGVADFQATATHVLIQSDVDPDVAPMHVLDVATGELAYIGLFHADEDKYYSARSTTGRNWGFDPTGRYVMHMAKYPTPLAAYDLEGRPAAFPADGETVRVHPDGVHVVCSADAVVAARPGDPDVIPLDTPTCEHSSFVGDHLEALIGGDLYRVPLDGSPRSLLAREIGAAREWLDEHHLLTVLDGELITVLSATNVRRRHASSVWNYRVYPGLGVYFWIVHYPASPGDGLWYLPESRLYPTQAPCITGFYCR